MDDFFDDVKTARELEYKLVNLVREYIKEYGFTKDEAIIVNTTAYCGCIERLLQNTSVVSDAYMGIKYWVNASHLGTLCGLKVFKSSTAKTGIIKPKQYGGLKY